MRACHTGGLHECAACGMQFEADEGLRAHQREHRGGSPGAEPVPGRLRLP